MPTVGFLSIHRQCEGEVCRDGETKAGGGAEKNRRGEKEARCTGGHREGQDSERAGQESPGGESVCHDNSLWLQQDAFNATLAGGCFIRSTIRKSPPKYL